MDISQDHEQKTVTIDTHPHMQVRVGLLILEQLGQQRTPHTGSSFVRVRVGWQTSCAYIHPCKHSSVMKKIILRQAECGKEPRVDQYAPRLQARCSRQMSCLADLAVLFLQ